MFYDKNADKTDVIEIFQRLSDKDRYTSRVFRHCEPSCRDRLPLLCLMI
ncbi:hypothetical protein [Suttonella indologenes]|nr:hypothetical protein [Suttonella indologenes]